MALVVEDGTNVANSNSYISVQDADTYHSARGNIVWANLGQSTKEQLLIKAMDYMTGTFGQSWVGLPTFTVQSLDWPRSVYSSSSLYTEVLLSIPQKLKEAQAEYALVAASTSLNPTVTRGKKSVKIGPLQVVYDGNSPVASKFVAAGQKLNGLLGSVSGGGSFVYRTARV